MAGRPLISTRPDTLFPYTALFRSEGFLATDVNRDARVRAVRRERLIEAFGLTEWQQQVTLRPALYARDGGPVPLVPAWAEFDEASRLAQAKRVVDAWRAAGREIEPVRIAVPDTPGGRILFAYVAADFNAIGVPSRRVAMASKADLERKGTRLHSSH